MRKRCDVCIKAMKINCEWNTMLVFSSLSRNNLLLIFTVIGLKLDEIVQYSPRRDTNFLNQFNA